MTEDAPQAPLSVAIATRDRPDALERCLASLARGRARPAEVVVVDQSDGPATERVVAAAATTFPTRYVRHPHGGLAGAQNRAFVEAREEVVAVLDDDCEADEEWLSRLATVFAAPDAPAVVAGQVLPLGSPAPGIYAVSSRTSTVRRDFHGKAAPWDVGSGNNFALRRTLFLDVGGCDERLGPGSPGRGGLDMDLFYRLLRAGAHVRYEPSVRVYHERKSLDERMARRVPYGFGMGACCALWLRQGDRYSLRVLASWLRLRLRLLLRALVRGRATGVREELLVLAGTARGLGYGARVEDGRREGSLGRAA